MTKMIFGLDIRDIKNTIRKNNQPKKDRKTFHQLLFFLTASNSGDFHRSQGIVRIKQDVSHLVTFFLFLMLKTSQLVVRTVQRVALKTQYMI